MLKVDDKIVVHGIMPPARVSKIWFDIDTNRHVIELDWGNRGNSKVYGHDEGKVWYKYDSCN